MVYEDKDIQLAFEQSSEQIESFFKKIGNEYNLTEKQIILLINSTKDFIFFLKMNKNERIELEKQYNKEVRDKTLDQFKRLSKFYSENQDLVDYIAPMREKTRFHKLFKYRIKALKNSVKANKKIRAGENKILIFAMETLFFSLEDFDIKRTQQLDIVYKLFKEFNFDDYGTEYHSKKFDFGEYEQKGRIRKQFQAPILANRMDYDELFEKLTSQKREYLKTSKGKEWRDFTYGRRKPE